jgi:hypothetical protein
MLLLKLVLSSFSLISGRIPSSVVAYANHRLSDPPVHFNESDFRRFAPSAIANGWLPSPCPPVINLDLGDRFYSETTGLRANDDLIAFFQEHGFVVFRVNSREWSLHATVRSETEVYDDVYPVTIQEDGSVLFGLHVEADTMMLIVSSTEAEAPSVFYTYPCLEVPSLTLSGSLCPDSRYLDCGGYAFLLVSYLEFPSNFTL